MSHSAAYPPRATWFVATPANELAIAVRRVGCTWRTRDIFRRLFRIRRWVALSRELDEFRYRKAMTAMSVGFVDGRRLMAEAGLRHHEAQALLRALAD
ncbi:MAG: hypothetical protein J2P51_14965, partial [Hyphomicrobiaceae bacterium]|nr:hypothetical protein [Hyphomicrobiaceae bacterium]